MTSLTPSPIMVALMQTATSLPFFLLALPAGAFADVVDRRRFLLATQGWMMAAAAVLGALTLAGVTTPWWLLALTFVLGLGAAMNAPAWQAITPELVPREEVPSAVALSGVGPTWRRRWGRPRRFHRRRRRTGVFLQRACASGVWCYRWPHTRPRCRLSTDWARGRHL
jgi:hypothetical protein